MQSLSWYVHRLGRMSGAEVAHRLGKAARNATRLLEISAPAAAPPPDLRAAERPFLPPFAAVAKVGQPRDIERLLDVARRIIDGRHDIFDLTDCALGQIPEWNRDPLTQRLAPWRAAASIDYRDEREVGNIKYLWEPNRHLHLPVLAQAYVLTGDARFAAAIRNHLDSWFAQCPAGRGPNWVSALELGIRLINWSITWQLLGGRRAALFTGPEGEAFRERWLASIYHHARTIAGNLSRFSSANNHLIGEAAGVFVAACTWPYWEAMQRWGERCRFVLLRECLQQNAPDGGNREQALSYQQFVLDFLLLSGRAARAAGQDFPADYWQRLEKMIDFIASLTDAGGHVPMIGDADDGYVVRLAPGDDGRAYRSLVATGAVLFDRPDLAVKAQDLKARHGERTTLDLKTLTLLGAPAAQAYSNLLARARGPYVLRREFPDCGYFILGEDFETTREVRAIVDAGPLGYLSLAAHGHADALAILLSLGGQEILIDPGTYAYHTDPEWRRYFRSTAAHNTLVVDDRDQSEQRGNFMWSRHAQARCLQFSGEGDSQHFAGEHDGYLHLEDPVIHRRGVRLQPGSMQIVDTLRCLHTHRAARHWHFAEDIAVEVDAQGMVTASTGSARVTLRPLEKLAGHRVYRGGSAEEGGWVSRRFGIKVPCTTVVWQSTAGGAEPAELTTQIEWRFSETLTA